jgi:hypothetical protein
MFVTEMQWLLEDIRPNYHSISDFRKTTLQLLKYVQTICFFLKDADLIEEVIAIDGTKSRAHNSKKANFNQKKIDKHLDYIEAKTQEYLCFGNDEKTELQSKTFNKKNRPREQITL